MNPEETSPQMITNLSTAPVKCSHCAWLKNGAIPPHSKHLENSMTELSGSIAGIFLLSYSLSSALMTSHQRHSLHLSLNYSRQLLVLGSNCCRRSLTKVSTNGVVALNAWYSKMGAISKNCLNN